MEIFLKSVLINKHLIDFNLSNYSKLILVLNNIQFSNEDYN